jgi:hypothetical protein
MSTYTITDQMWLSDSLNWEKTSLIAVFDWSILNFLFQSSFLSNYIFNDFLLKLSNLDSILLHLNSKLRSPQILYDYFIYDTILFFNLYYLPLSTLLVSEYQEPISTVTILSPELFSLFSEYINLYIITSSINNSPSVVFDFYLSNLNFFYGEGCIQLFLFFIYTYFIVYVFTSTFLLK